MKRRSWLVFPAGVVSALFAKPAAAQWSIYTRGPGSIAAVRTITLADGTSITANADTSDQCNQANTQAAGTLTINAPTGTPIDGQTLVLRIKSTNVQTFSWNGVYRGSADLALPTASTGGGKTDYLGVRYDAADAKWDLVSKNFGF